MNIAEIFESNSLRVVFGGRFQPPTPAHHNVYKHLVERFGKDNVFIATSDKIGYNKQKKTESYFNFEDKKLMWTKLFKVDPSKIILSNNPAFTPNECFEGLKDVAHITVTSEKDKTRYENSNHFEIFEDNSNLMPFPLKSYYYICETMNNGLNASSIRETLKSNLSLREKKMFFERTYNKYDENIFNLMMTKLI